MLLYQTWSLCNRYITGGTVTMACVTCHPSCWVGAEKSSKGDMYYQSIHRYLLTADKNLGTLPSESGMEFNVVDTVKKKAFLSTFTLYLSTFLHLTVPHHSHFLGSYRSHPGSHLHVRLVSIASWLSLNWLTNEKFLGFCTQLILFSYWFLTQAS